MAASIDVKRAKELIEEFKTLQKKEAEKKLLEFVSFVGFPNVVEAYLECKKK